LILLIGLDGLDPDLVARLWRAGRLPNLAALEAEGASGRLRSTFPPVSVPAWSTFLTGVGPGRHGLFDFTTLDDFSTPQNFSAPQKGRIRFLNAADRRVPTFLELLDGVGRRACSIGFPTTYPVSRLERGAMLSGFDSPFAGAPDEAALHPLELWRRLGREGLDLRASTLTEGRKGRGWHRAAAERILDSVERRLAQAKRLLREGPWDLFCVHFQAADTAGHHFWRYFDPASPRYDGSRPDRAAVLPAVYDALDRAVGELRRSAPDDALCVVLSDHGMGPASDRVIHLNRWLEQEGFLVRRRAARGRAAGALRSAAVGWVPRSLQSLLFRRLRDGAVAGVETALRLGEIDPEGSVAFSEESSTLPGVWILEPDRREELIRRLRAWPAVTRVYRREDLYRGPMRTRAPHLLLELRHGLVRTPAGYAGPACRRLQTRELDGTRGAGLNGVHRPEGLLLAASGPTSASMVAAEGLEGAWIGDLAPTVLAVLGVPIPEWMEGRPLPALSPSPRWSDQPLRAPLRPSDARLSPAQAARLERRLRALGYLG
jgi:predicted AlkP superfamily phosphohydrolase/phosphomutase